MCQVAWKFGKISGEWQTGVIIPIFKKKDRKQCTNYTGISLLSLPGKLYAKYLGRKCLEIVESNLEDGQYGFRLCRSTTGQIFTLKQIFEKSWEYGKDLFACFVDLETAYDQVPRYKLWKVLQEYGVNGHSTADLNLCSGKWQATKSVPCERWTPARVRFVTSPFHCLHELDRQMQPSQ